MSQHSLLSIPEKRREAMKKRRLKGGLPFYASLLARGIRPAWLAVGFLGVISYSAYLRARR